MGIILESAVVDGKRDEVFRKMSDADFIRKIDPNAGQGVEVSLDTARVLRSSSVVEKVGRVETERILLPELFAIVSQRRGDTSPFTYQVSIQMLGEAGEGTVVNWIVDFGLEDRMKEKEECFSSIIRSHAQGNLERARLYFSSP
jgi:hypothetical protein